MIQTQLFHPKLYFFENSENDWATIIGSHNFTNGVFNNKYLEISKFTLFKDSNNPSIRK